MSSSANESGKQSATAQDFRGTHNEVLDFLYVDRARVSALYAQLFPQGILTGVKTIKQESSSEDYNVGGNIKIFKAEGTTKTGSLEGIEHMFDATWAIPLDVLDALAKRRLVRTSIFDAPTGSILYESKAFVRLVDPSIVNQMASSLSTELAGELGPEAALGLRVLQCLPNAIQGHYLTPEARLWSVVNPTGLTIPVSDLTLKHGGTLADTWQILYILDTYNDRGAAPVFEEWSAGQLSDSIVQIAHNARLAAGRPADWLGITPLMIFRAIPPIGNAEALDPI